MKKKISCSKEKARELASKFGVSQKTVEEFSYQNKNLGKVLQRNDDPQEPVFEPVAAKDAEVGGIAVDRLRSLIERIERLEEEKKVIARDIRDIFAEAKSAGFDVKVMREILKLRKMDAADRDEKEILLETYRKALGL